MPGKLLLLRIQQETKQTNIPVLLELTFSEEDEQEANQQINKHLLYNKYNFLLCKEKLTEGGKFPLQDAQEMSPGGSNIWPET